MNTYGHCPLCGEKNCDNREHLRIIARQTGHIRRCASCQRINTHALKFCYFCGKQIERKDQKS